MDNLFYRIKKASSHFHQITRNYWYFEIVYQQVDSAPKGKRAYLSTVRNTAGTMAELGLNS